MNGGFTHQTPFENCHILALELNISSLSLFCFLFFCLFPSLSLQAVKLTTLQPIWRTWNEDFGVSALAFEFVLWWWTAVEWCSRMCLYYNHEQRPQPGGGVPSPRHILRFYHNKKTDISDFHHIYSFIFKRIESTSFIFIWSKNRSAVPLCEQRKQEVWSYRDQSFYIFLLFSTFFSLSPSSSCYCQRVWTFVTFMFSRETNKCWIIWFIIQ